MEISKEKGERLCLNGAIQFKGFFFILCMFICFNTLIMVRVFTNIMNHMRACKLVLLITLLLIDCHNILLGSTLHWLSLCNFHLPLKTNFTCGILKFFSN